MRKALESISLAVLALQAWVYWLNVYGPAHLPARIPVHFDLAGNPNGWGTPSSFLFIPILSAALYLFLTVIAQFSSTFNYPIQVTDETRARLEALTMDLLAWLKMELVSTLALVLWTCVHMARHPEPASHALYLFAPVGVVFATIAWFIVAMLKPVRVQSVV